MSWYEIFMCWLIFNELWLIGKLEQYLQGQAYEKQQERLRAFKAPPARNDG